MGELTPSLDPLYYNESYDPLATLLSYTSIYGSDTTITFEALQVIVNKKITQAIVFGTRIGAAGISIIILWMISKNRKTPIFLINQVSLFLILLHSSLYLAYLMRNFGSIAFALTWFPQLVSQNDLRIYAATDIAQVLLVASVEISLIFQIRVIFKSDNFKRLGPLFIALSIATGAATIGMWLYTAVKSIIAVYKNPLNEAANVALNVSIILLASSVNFMTLLLVIKLIIAIKSRRFLGLKQFNTFHILLIMSTQTLIIPSVLFVLSYALDDAQGTQTLTSVAILLVVLSLPLSSMWATSANNDSTPTSYNPRFHTYSGNTDGSSFLSYGRTMYDKSSYANSPYKADGTSTRELDISTQMDDDFEKGIECSNNAGNMYGQCYRPRNAEDELKKIDNEIQSSMNTPNTVVDKDANELWENTMQNYDDDGLLESKMIFKDLS